MKYKKHLKEIDELIMLYEEMSKTECSNDIRCWLKKSAIFVEFRKKIDKLLHQIAFIYLSSSEQENEQERITIESLIDKFAENGLITMRQWELALMHAINYKQYLNRKRGGIKVENQEVNE